MISESRLSEMKQFIIFTSEELNDLFDGREIEFRMPSGEIVYFMLKEHYDELYKKENKNG